jgi:hypothetical protein
VKHWTVADAVREILQNAIDHSGGTLEILEQFLKDNRGEMRTKAIVAFKQLIESAEKWK